VNVILIVILVLVGVVLLLTASWAYLTADRLDRLHVRYDLSWQALDAALARRAVVARAVSVDAYGSGPEGRRLAALAAAAERAERPAREGVENALSAALQLVDPASLPTALVAELADAEARVLLARRFHNDAVRDTLSLRERPMVRLLHLGGTAALPGYFEIAERAGMPGGPAGHRVSARIALLDEQGRILLFCGSDPAAADGPAPRWWFTVGGAAQPGESLVQTAVRELAEETGLQVAVEEMVGPVWRREAIIDFNGSVMRSEEFFFVHRTAHFEPSTTGHSALERSYLHGHKWCDATMVRELVASGEPVYPVQLAELLAEANRLADGQDSGDESQPHPIR